jgi:hypothetical protein
MELYVRGSIDRKTLYPNDGKREENLSFIFDSKDEMGDGKMN